MKIRNIGNLILLGLLICLLPLSSVLSVGGTTASGTTNKKPITESFDDMYAAFDLWDLAGALDIYNGEPDLASYEDENHGAASDLSRYCRARLYMEENDYKNAEISLLPLESYNPTKNSNEASDKLLAYCRGRIAESSGDYEEAIAQYSSVNFSDSEDRLRDCKEKAGLVAQERSYNELAERCRAAIAEKDIATVSECAAALKNMNGYKDSAKLLEDCQKLLKADARELTISQPRTGRKTVMLTWKDNESGHKYTVSYAPKGCEQGDAIQVGAVYSYEAKGLIPGTEYVFIISDADEPLVTRSVSASTEKASKVPLTGLESENIELVLLQKKYLRRSSSIEVFEKGLYEQAAEGLLSTSVLSVSSPFVYISLSRSEEAASSAEFVCVIHSDRGTYASEAEILEFPAGDYVYCLTELEPLLEQMLDSYGELTPFSGTVEIYLDDILYGSTRIGVSGEKE